MNPADFQAIASSPAVFRRSLMIDVSGDLKPFKPDDWQERDFLATDPMWLHAAGKGPRPRVMRSFQCRPRGHSKTSDIAIQCTWLLAFAPRPVRIIGAAADRDQCQLLRDAIATLGRCNQWLQDLLDVQ